ncbi:ERF family protein [Streptomyces solisilvae]|uniref:ERF family protein n=1 Tax=Streptomyces malaysiensis TaxID=92644 RepID=UPI003690468A
MTTAARRPRRIPMRTRTILRRPATPAPHPDRTPPEVTLHEAIRRVMRDMPPVPKRGYNKDDGFYYKQLEDVILTLREVCIRHGVIITSSHVVKNRYAHGPLAAIDVHVTYEVTGPDGSSKKLEYVGEARSDTDKATQIAMQFCWKGLMSQLFMIPSEEDIDADAHSPRVPNVRDIKNQGRGGSQKEQRAAAQRRHPAGRQRPQETGRQQGTGQGAPRIPAQRGPDSPGSPDQAPDTKATKAIAARLARAASAARADDVIPILEEAKEAGAPAPELEAIREIGRIKRAAETKAANAATGPEHQGRNDETGQRDQATGPDGKLPGASGQDAARPVPPVDVPEQSPQAAAHVKALEFFNECSALAGWETPAAAAQMFAQRHGKPLEEAEVHEIEAFAAGMIPDGVPDGEDGPENEETGE